MKKLTLCIFVIAIAHMAVASDHIMEVISGDLGNSTQVVEHDDRIYVPNGSVLKVYDGSTFTDFPMPVVSGVSLRFRNSILVLNGSVFVAMSDETRHYISRFTGTGFSRRTLPGLLVSDVVVFNGQMHMLLQDASGIRLCSYDGITLRELSSALPITNNYNLLVAGHHLYINGIGYYAGDPNWLMRYNGAAFSSIALPPGTRRLSSALQDGSSSSAYIVLDELVAYFYNGSFLTELFRSVPGLPIHSETMMRNEFYFRFGNDTPEFPERIIKFNRTTRTEIFAPAGTRFIHPPDRELALYRGDMYMPLDADGLTSIYTYDGADWERIYDWIGPRHNLVVRERAGKLVFYGLLSGRQAVEYDGTTFESFTVPEGIQWFVTPKASTSCYHIWLMSFVDTDYRWVLVKETFDSTCVAAGTVPVIPERLRDYERFHMGAYARERDWCWTNLEIDFDITPICLTPPCPPPVIQTTMADKAGKIVWQKAFDAPFAAKVPLKDTQPYTLAFALGDGKVFNGVLRLDKELVNVGIEQLEVDMYPKQDHFFLTVMTDKGKEVPLMVTLRNSKGESLWQQKFVAPMDELIRTFVPKAGDYLQFSVAQARKSAVSYYPNPFQSALTINTKETTGTVLVTLTDLNGKVIAKNVFIDPGEYLLDASGQKAGLYVLTIVENEKARKELVEIKK